MMQRRPKRMQVCMIIIALILLTLIAAGSLLWDWAMVTDLSQKDLPPSWQHPFGTDWLGRDMLARTISGLASSMGMGVICAVLSALFALAMGLGAALLGKKADGLIVWLIDLFLSIPHILLLILIAFACGKGFWGVATGITFTHWMSLARVMRIEALQIRYSGYVQVALKLGVHKARIAHRHFLPHLLPQLFVGLVMLFPHVILHEASITFLGFGLSSQQPAIGIILAESMRYLILGQWWLAVFPGLGLVWMVLLFSILSNALRKRLNPSEYQQEASWIIKNQYLRSNSYP